MEMATQTESRVDRRRRLMSREMDRMALITGRIKNLPPSPPPSPSSPSPFLYNHHAHTHQRGHSHTGISPSFFSKDLHKNPDSVPVISHIHGIPKPRDEKAATLLKSMSSNEVVLEEKKNAVIGGYQINYQKLNPIGEVTSPVSSPSAISVAEKASIFKEPAESKTQFSKPKLFTSKRVNSCIIASQTTRVYCSVIIASLAVLSHLDHLLFIIRNIVRPESTVASKPLYILLLTDATIIVARMLSERQKGGMEEVAAVEEEPEKVVVKEDAHNSWESAVKLLERGLVFYQAFRAIFIDFSVYAVVVICGLSLL
ncbi:uncharacterized protein LOC111021081 [Momordica charantia]|uniref:Uncharacterized protein LOC111021081 n=1 Tax=Momordica charantia TaxID=3673 RepID=A0A6J1DHA8_MOMCH|nr:uncharacterized protein LOC111021081 [Momordica charantia]